MKKAIFDFWAGAVAYSTEYQTILTRAATNKVATPSATQKRLQDTFLQALKTAGIWAVTDTLKVINTDGSSNFSDINWTSPSSYASVKTKTPLFVRNSGITNNGTDSYIDMGWKPSNGVNGSQNSCEFVIYYKSIPSSFGSIPDGVRVSSSDSAMNPQAASGQVVARSNSGTGTSNFSDAQFDLTDGLYFFGRTGANSEFVKKGSGSRVTAANASVTPPNLNWFLGAFNNAGTPALNNARTVGLFWAGGVLTTQQETDFKTAWDAYLTGVNAQTALSTIGTIYNKSSWTDLTDFTNNGSTSSVVSNAISFSGGAGTYTQTLDLTSKTKLGKWTITARFKIGENTLTSYGFGVGIRSTNSSGLVDVSGRFYMATGANQGKLFLNGDASHTQLNVTSSAITFSVNDVIELVLTLNDDVLTLTGRNVTTAGSTLSTTYTYTGGSPYMPNTGRFAIYSIGGAFTCTQFTVSSTEYYQPTLMVIGDSKSQRYNATRYGYSFVQLLQDSYGPLTNYSGGYNKTADVLASISEVINTIRPIKVILAIGSNDVRYGVADATMKSNYASIVSQLTAAGITVLHTTGLYETAISQASLQAYINANYSSADIIDSVDTVLTLAGDGIHPIDAGHSTFASLLINSGKISIT